MHNGTVGVKRENIAYVAAWEDRQVTAVAKNKSVRTTRTAAQNAQMHPWEHALVDSFMAFKLSVPDGNKRRGGAEMQYSIMRISRGLRVLQHSETDGYGNTFPAGASVIEGRLLGAWGDGPETWSEFRKPLKRGVSAENKLLRFTDLSQAGERVYFAEKCTLLKAHVDVDDARESAPAAYLNSITSYGKMMQELDRGSVLRSWSSVEDTAPDEEILDDSVDETLACMECKSLGPSGKHRFFCTAGI